MHILRSAERAKQDGGGGGIRTHGARKGTTVFETAPFNHSGTPPTVFPLAQRGNYTPVAAATLAQGMHPRKTPKKR